MNKKEKALKDFNCAIKLNDKYIKPYLRKAEIYA